MTGIKITIDTAQMDAFVSGLLSPAGLTALTAGIAANVRDHWIRLAGERLTSSRRDYVNGIQAVQMTDTTAVIALVGGLANMIEQGTPGFDMRDTLLRPQGLHHRVIPFRHRGPDSRGATGGGKPIGAAYKEMLGEAGAKKLGREIYKAVKSLGPGESLGSGAAPKLRAHHSDDIYAGMQKMKTGEGKGQTRYMTFRTISIDSPADSWLYPATAGRNLVDEVVNDIPNVVEKIIHGLIDGMAQGGSK